MSLVILKEIGKDFNTGVNTISPLTGINLEINKNDKLIIYGKSGSGKTTLLNILSTLEIPSKGSMVFSNEPIESLSDKDLSNLRLNDIGVVFQSHHLLEEFSLYENIILPGSINQDLDKDFAHFLIEKLKISDRKNHLPDQLSGGERQRCAIARALINKPKLLVMDEPTGDLDRNTSDEVMELIDNVFNEIDIAVVIATHDENLKFLPKSKYLLEQGKLNLIQG